MEKGFLLIKETKKRIINIETVQKEKENKELRPPAPVSGCISDPSPWESVSFHPRM